MLENDGTNNFFTVKKIPYLNDALGEQLKKARKSIPKLSQEQVAIALGTERSYISRMERGIILPSINVLILLGEMYGVPASTLLLWTEQALSNHVSRRSESLFRGAFPCKIKRADEYFHRLVSFLSGLVSPASCRPF